MSRGRAWIVVVVAAALGVPLAGAAQGPRPAVAAKASGSLTAFRSDAELRRFLRGTRRPPPPPSPSSPSQGSPVTVVNSQEVTNTGTTRTEDLINSLPQVFAGQGITNNQEADVDEGGIVKVRGDILVILRRGRLFTVSLAGGGMRPIDSIDAFPPGASGQGSWYDEMLLSDDRIVVVGYSYARGGTEINRFRLAPNGRLRFEDAYHLRSDDYYSSSNYASRLIGSRLLLYAPLYLDWEDDPLEILPGLRKWRPGLERDAPFRRIAGASQIFIAPRMRGEREALDALHTVTNCDLTAPVLRCSAIGVIGPASRTFYVSSSAVYLWISDWHRRSDAESFLFRLPLGREPPSAIATQGSPNDQFSFREDAAEGAVNVLVGEYGGGDAMGRPGSSHGRIALLRLPIAELGDGSAAAAPSRYRQLPNPRGDSGSFHNRFVGDHVLYGRGRWGEEDRKTRNIVVAPIRGGPVAELNLRHVVDRIEILGRDALVVGGGARGSLNFTAVELPAGGRPALGDLFTLPAAGEGESRSHAFFFRPTSPDGASGILGLPITRQVEPQYRRLFGSAAAMLFLRRDQRRFANAGELGANVRGAVEDHCEASCTDWYGNARPIFLGDRIFALLGYELVEGRLADGRISEIGRVDFAPRRRTSVNARRGPPARPWWQG